MKSAYGIMLGTIAVLAACSDDASAPPVTTPPANTNDAGPAPAPTGTLSILVFDPPPTGREVTTPLAGIHVAFYPPGDGAMVEVVTGADGVASFTGIDWSQGSGELVTYADGYTASALSDVSPDNIANAERYWNHDGLVAAMQKLESTVKNTLVTGALTNKTAASDSVKLAATGNNTFFNAQTSTFQLLMKNDQPFTIVAADLGSTTAIGAATINHWVTVSAPANATTVDIDFATATPLPTQNITTTYMMPEWARGVGSTALVYYPFLEMTLEDAENMPLGMNTSVLKSADQTTATVTSTVAMGFPGSLLSFYVLVGKDSSQSFIVTETMPADGGVATGFMQPPSLSDGVLKVLSPVNLTNLVPTEGAGVSISDASGDLVLTRSSLLEAKDTTLTMAALKGLPDAVNAKIGTTGLSATVSARLRGDSLGTTNFPAHYLVSAPFVVTQ